MKAKIPNQYAGQRLDKALILLFPETSLRHRRRLFTSWNIRVDDVVRGPAFKVQAGQELIAIEKSDADQASLLRRAAVHAVSPPWAALYKPAGLDSVTLPGGSRPGLDQILVELDSAETAHSEESPGWRLASRLDRDVSGLVVAVQGRGAEERFRRMEAAGEVGKTYLLLADTADAARLSADQERIIKNALDMHDRRKVRVLDEDDPDPSRWTHLAVLGQILLDDKKMTLVRAEIARGARHQIRAHAAAAGLPIVGDPIYGAGAHPSGILFLHCAALRVEGFAVECPPPWDAALGEEGGRLLDLAELASSPEK
ncbi:pseudouridine synthase [Oceanidesulfovibrio indonesiensis]|uniref:Pseudouridine synthase n=1 Tax=Oceanidesulfovibrio indonesiensis TaxID=54767 RepID=A0A7M3MEX8_9BACT|nr:RNA pseudouridine synthase [Oceanidesulfovibrio indonesiensis]TVM17569.1 pseudouridine synthase [Oceanidesulfovibrio indonesiensis]